MTPARAKTATLPIDEPDPRVRPIGVVREGEIDHHRVMFVEVDVEVAGRFAFYADLCDEEGDSIGHVEGTRELAAGRVEVALPMTLSEPDAAVVLEGLRIVRRR